MGNTIRQTAPIKAITWFESYFSESNSNYLNARSDGDFDIEVSIKM